jgi:hypothetical protein
VHWGSDVSCLSDSDLRQTPHPALPLKLAICSHPAVQILAEVELQRACCMAAEGYKLVSTNGPTCQVRNPQLLQPWQVGPNRRPEVI